MASKIYTATCTHCDGEFPATARQWRAFSIGRPTYCSEDCRKAEFRKRKNAKNLRRYHLARAALNGRVEERTCRCGATFTALKARDRELCDACRLRKPTGVIRVTPVRNVPDYAMLNFCTGYPATHAVNCPIL
jgi:hypothetical protein